MVYLALQEIDSFFEYQKINFGAKRISGYFDLISFSYFIIRFIFCLFVGLDLWHINNCRLFNAKFSLYMDRIYYVSPIIQFFIVLNGLNYSNSTLIILFNIRL